MTSYALRSTVLGNQVVAELQFWNNSWNWGRGYVYLGGQLLALQQNSTVVWVHQDPIVKSQRLTDTNGTVTTGIELDAWGGETNRSWNSGQQTRKFTTYERDGSGNDQAMYRQYHSYWMRFDQPDPYGGSYNAADPQSFNRYNYVQNDPVNYVDPSGLNPAGPGTTYGGGMLWTLWVKNENGLYNFVRQWFEPYGSGEMSQQPTATDKLVERARQLAAQPNLNDCKALVSLIKYAGELFQNVIGATNALGHVLAGGDTIDLALHSLSGTNPQARVEFGQNGFRTEFLNTTSPNQVRHFMGGLIAGSLMGESRGLSRMNARERDPQGADAGDVRLNEVSVPLGSDLRLHNGEFGYNKSLAGTERMNQLGDDVLNKICDPKTP